ncbi:FtsX-like permease family protein [Cellulomonas soli]|uniref:FtsX-like permease family protein n=1 Tax=Cellulomonas soli TaxID=931535 RepID=UPI003F86D952
MNPVLALAPRLQRAGGRDARVVTGLAVTAFAVSTALTLSVVGGLLGFVHRAQHPTSQYLTDVGDAYVLFAWTALVLLVVPLITLGGAAARLGVSRRDARLATLRLLGATPREVVGLTLVETVGQGFVGAVAGTLLYGALLPLWALVPFQGTTFTVSELWVGWPGVLGALVGAPLLALVSGAVSLRRVTVSPLGVARRQTPPGLSALRLVLALVGAGAFMVVSATLGMWGAAAVILLVAMFAVAFATLNALGPWTLGLLGRLLLRRANTPARLLAARRLLDDPRATWRIVGGLGLAGFVAGSLAVVPVLTVGQDVDAEGQLLFDDIVTGAMLTLVITFLVAAASAGISQAASVLDRRREYALADLAGVPVELLDAVRRREVLVPLLAVAVGSAVLALVMLLPLFGMAAVQSPGGLLLLVGCLTGGVLLVVAATETSRPLLRSVLATTVVRAD